jgi:hypothetical protein
MDTSPHAGGRESGPAQLNKPPGAKLPDFR